MRTGVLFGENEISENDKRLKRITASFEDKIYNIIDEIAGYKGLSQSEVVYRLCIAQLKTIKRQKEIIVNNPLQTAFDLCTKDKK